MLYHQVRFSGFALDALGEGGIWNVPLTQNSGLRLQSESKKPAVAVIGVFHGRFQIRIPTTCSSLAKHQISIHSQGTGRCQQRLPFPQAYVPRELEINNFVPVSI